MLKDWTARDWGALVVSLIILAYFGYIEWHVVTFGLPKDDQATTALINILQNLVVLVAGYWIGSSSSSRSKDISREVTPVPIVTPVPNETPR